MISSDAFSLNIGRHATQVAKIYQRDLSYIQMVVLECTIIYVNSLFAD